MKNKHSSSLALGVIVFLALTVAAIGQPGIGAERHLPFASRSDKFRNESIELSKLISNYMSVNDGMEVEFNAETALDAGFDVSIVKLAEQMVGFANGIRWQAKLSSDQIEEVDIRSLDVDLSLYPELDEFLARARDFNREVDKTGYDAEAMVPMATATVYQTCGYFDSPRPTRSAPWRTHTSSNSANTLRSWGYHSTLGLIGGGWTRAQTYKWWMCGFGTYRDHAIVSSSTRFREQNYSGFTPRGEPNPEVYASGPWPYAVWPVYVRIWHETF